MTALFPSLSLFLPVPIFSWLHLLLRQGPWVRYLALPIVVSTLAVGPGVSYAFWLSFALHQALGPGSSSYSSPLGFPTFAMGSPLRGRGLFVLDRNEGLVSPFGSGTLVSSWLDLTPLSVASLRALSLRVCCQVVLAVSVSLGCPQLPPVFFPVPCWGSGLPPRPLLWVWGCLGGPALLLPAGVLYFGRWLDLRPEAAGALLPGGPHCS